MRTAFHTLRSCRHKQKPGNVERYSAYFEINPLSWKSKSTKLKREVFKPGLGKCTLGVGRNQKTCIRWRLLGQQFSFSAGGACVSFWLAAHSIAPHANPDQASINGSVADNDIPNYKYILNCLLKKSKSYHPNQEDCNDFIRDLGVTNPNAEQLTLRIKQSNSVDDSVQIWATAPSVLHFYAMPKCCWAFDSTGIPCTEVTGFFSITPHLEVVKPGFFKV